MNRDGEVTFVLNSRRITGNSLGITALTDDPLFAVGSAGGWRDLAPNVHICTGKPLKLHCFCALCAPQTRNRLGIGRRVPVEAPIFTGFCAIPKRKAAPAAAVCDFPQANSRCLGGGCRE